MRENRLKKHNTFQPKWLRTWNGIRIRSLPCVNHSTVNKVYSDPKVRKNYVFRPEQVHVLPRWSLCKRWRHWACRRRWLGTSWLSGSRRGNEVSASAWRRAWWSSRRRPWRLATCPASLEPRQAARDSGILALQLAALSYTTDVNEDCGLLGYDVV